VGSVERVQAEQAAVSPDEFAVAHMLLASAVPRPRALVAQHGAAATAAPRGSSSHEDAVPLEVVSPLSALSPSGARPPTISLRRRGVGPGTVGRASPSFPPPLASPKQLSTPSKLAMQGIHCATAIIRHCRSNTVSQGKSSATKAQI
jgi:hypothetical protein